MISFGRKYVSRHPFIIKNYYHYIEKKKQGTPITVGETTYGELERARYVQA